MSLVIISFKHVLLYTEIASVVLSFFWFLPLICDHKGCVAKAASRHGETRDPQQGKQKIGLVLRISAECCSYSHTLSAGSMLKPSIPSPGAYGQTRNPSILASSSTLAPARLLPQISHHLPSNHRLLRASVPKILPMSPIHRRARRRPQQKS